MPRHTPDEEEAYREAQHEYRQEQFRKHDAFRQSNAERGY